MRVFRGLVLLAAVLLAGCRAERAAFRFRAEAMPTASSSMLPLGNHQIEEPTSQTVQIPILEVRWQKRVLQANRKRCVTKWPNAAVATGIAYTKTTLRSNNTFLPRQPNHQQPIKSPWGGILFLGGLAICVAAVIIGINLGGFLGLAGGYVLFFAGALVSALGYAGPDKPDPTKPKSEQGLRPYLNLLFGSLASVLLIGGGLGLLLHGGTSYLAATLTGAAMMLSYYVYNLLKNHSRLNTN